MVDMGFEAQVNSVLDAMPSSNLRPENPDEIEANRHYRQTHMFSATMPPAVEKIAKKSARGRGEGEVEGAGALERRKRRTCGERGIEFEWQAHVHAMPRALIVLLFFPFRAPGTCGSR